MTAFGIPNANFGDNFTSGLGEFDMDGTGSNFGDGLGVARCNCPLIERERQYQSVGNMTKMKGNHQFKFGADVRYATNLRVPSDSNRTGVYAFSHQATSSGGSGGVRLRHLPAGGCYPVEPLCQHQRRMRPSASIACSSTARSTWRVTPKFTLNYGLRWEVYFPEYVNGKDNGGFANIVQGVVRVAGEGGIGLNGNIDNKWSYLAPRVGMAYQLNPKTVVRMGYGRSYDMGVFGSNFGHAVTQNLPVLASQFVQPGVPNKFAAFTLDQGPPVFTFPAIPSSGLFPLAGPSCYQAGTVVIGGVTQVQSCTQPHIRPTFQRLPTLDAWNATLQRQLNNTTSLEVAYIGNKGTHAFAGDGNTYNVNQPFIAPGTAIVTTAGSAPGFSPATPQVQRRPYYNAFAYPGIPDPSSTTGVLMCCSTDQGNYFGQRRQQHLQRPAGEG